MIIPGRLLLALTRCGVVLVLWAACECPLGGPAEAGVSDTGPGHHTGGMGLGFVANTPDGVAEFGVSGHADYFVGHNISVGPLVQYAGAGNDFLVGVSAQAKYWWEIPGSDHRAKVTIQGGVGFIRAGIKDTDSGAADTYGSFLLPLGIGLDYALTPRVALTVDALVNMTSLGDTVQAGGRQVDLHTHVMPAFYLGVRF